MDSYCSRTDVHGPHGWTFEEQGRTRSGFCSGIL